MVSQRRDGRRRYSSSGATEERDGRTNATNRRNTFDALAIDREWTRKRIEQSDDQGAYGAMKKPARVTRTVS